MRYLSLFFALGLMVAAVSPAYAECAAHQQNASASDSSNTSQAKLKQSKVDRAS